MLMLDTSAAIPLRDQHPATLERIEALREPLVLSIVTLVELEGGVVRDETQARARRVQLDLMLESIPVLAFDAACAAAYRRIVETLGHSRRNLLDRMIAAQALAHDATLVTLNGADFADIPGLKLLSW